MIPGNDYQIIHDFFKILLGNSAVVLCVYVQYHTCTDENQMTAASVRDVKGYTTALTGMLIG